MNALVSDITDVCFVLNSFDRLLVHGVCQFLDLKSTSEYIAKRLWIPFNTFSPLAWDWF